MNSLFMWRTHSCLLECDFLSRRTCCSQHTAASHK